MPAGDTADLKLARNQALIQSVPGLYLPERIASRSLCVMWALRVEGVASAMKPL
jgi:hypothetical protein